MTPAQPSLAPALSAARHTAEDTSASASDPHPKQPGKRPLARLAALSPEARANILVLLPALLSLGHSCGKLLPPAREATLKARRRQLGWALLSSAHGVSTLRMALVMREWVEEARERHHKHKDEGDDAPLADRVGELLSWGAEVLEVAALALGIATLAVRLRGMKRAYHVLDHCGESLEQGSLWLAALGLPPAWVSISARGERVGRGGAGSGHSGGGCRAIWPAGAARAVPLAREGKCQRRRGGCLGGDECRSAAAGPVTMGCSQQSERHRPTCVASSCTLHRQ